MNTLGRIPQITDTVECMGLRLEEVDMDGRRVDKVLVSWRTPPGPDLESHKDGEEMESESE